MGFFTFLRVSAQLCLWGVTKRTPYGGVPVGHWRGREGGWLQAV